jgi:hypothetical protein
MRDGSSISSGDEGEVVLPSRLSMNLGYPNLQVPKTLAGHCLLAEFGMLEESGTVPKEGSALEDFYSSAWPR